MAEKTTAGALVLHGFTSTTATMQPVADALGAAGYETELPLLPGHGTRWQDLADTRAEEILAAVEAAYDRLAARCDVVVPVGLSMGGALALHCGAAREPAGVVVINPGLKLRRFTGLVAQVLGTVVPSIAPIGSDIAKPGAVEEAYPVTPVRAVVQLDRIFRRVRSELETIRERRTPVLLMRSPRDAVLGSASGDLLKRRLDPDRDGSQLTEVILRRSQHVATLDYDADLITRRADRFIAERLAHRG